MKSVLQRWARDVGDRYELDENQQTEVEQAVVQRWTGFLNDHRKSLQPLFNEYLELRMSVDPPEKESVMAWAKRAESSFDMVRDQLTQATQDVRKVLTPRQRINFDTDMLALGGGLALAKQRLERFQKGDFEPREFWTPPASQRRKRREARKQKRRKHAEETEALKKPSSQPHYELVDQITIELDRWQVYVADFMARYELDNGQRNAALSLLRELSQRARDHRNRYRDEIDRLERRIAKNSGSEAEMERINKDLVRLYGPIDELFAELKTRLNVIPSGAQRERAAQRSTLSQEKNKDSKAGNSGQNKHVPKR